MDKFIGKMFQFTTWYEGQAWYKQALLSPVAMLTWAATTAWMQFNG